jgi:hypothetical protein
MARNFAQEIISASKLASFSAKRKIITVPNVIEVSKNFSALLNFLFISVLSKLKYKKFVSERVFRKLI